MEVHQRLRMREQRLLALHHQHRHRRMIGNPLVPQRAPIREVLQRIQELSKKEGRGDRMERLTADADVLSFSAQDGKVGLFISAGALTPENNYFEIEILDAGLSGVIGVGLVPYNYRLDRQPGWDPDSVAYHADDGNLFKSNGLGRPFGPKCQAGDKMGCGIKFEQVKEDMAVQHMAPVFFTRNGKEIGTVLAPMPAEGLYPAIGMHSEGEEVRLNLDAKYDQSEVLMSIDSCDEDWARLHDVRVRGQLLEYVGRGSSISDVGLAQSRRPLNTRHHYFEIEITDPGDKCYIAIGLARRNYPKERHPGWNKGSIAYHADDGKLFVGSGVGDHFGPECHKGDIMGCGILFPRDYNSKADSDGDDEDDEDYLDLEDMGSSDSEDEDWRDHPFVEQGTKVQVFFTRNGETIGRREVQIPKGGFYPTVGMLSSDEKVRVDLRPLTG